ncbi:ATP-binding protein [Kineosporia sp. NBRC 101731]|uniref:ATP-binding protein n=1 Tax=Kineosporia sp. NBRC 101731 TaxID=3032199 RepID=UPI0024A32734|nr:ATP-binding protein [Kineosporia sp. NBRC 101731]GLY32356.1 dihydroorotate dehydrogenase [Kineosporia sp. NBRC 101731]
MALVARLRAAGEDTTDVEVKAAAGGLPDSLTPSLSALANLPGGGTIILGLDERADFAPVGLSSVQQLKQGLVSKSRSLVPPVQLAIGDGTVHGQPVVIARVHECDPSSKPCRVAATGKAYLRSYDGDFELSQVEEQGFLAARTLPHFDRRPVEGATREDLDEELLSSFIRAVRDRDPSGLGRFRSNEELLRRAGVALDGGQPSVAGLLALGVYPQQFFPRYVIQAAAESRPDDPIGVRARNQMTITGPIPRMLDEAMAWARRAFDSVITTEAGGMVVDQPEYPLVAFRELIANALVHRDLDNWSEGLSVEVRLRRDRLVVSNPGGLYGITADRLGREGVTSARNARLVAICQHVRTPDTGARVIEALASGLPIVGSSLSEAGLPPAKFFDAAIRFTALLTRSDVRKKSGTSLTPTQQRIYEALERMSTVKELEDALGLAGATLRKALRAMANLGLVSQQGGRGRSTTYHRM